MAVHRFIAYLYFGLCQNRLHDALKFFNMLKSGILNPQLLSLLARVRHTNTLVIADRGFPFWPQVETIDISLVDDIPTVLEVLAAIRPNFVIARAWMAEEFLRV